MNPTASVSSYITRGRDIASRECGVCDCVRVGVLCLHGDEFDESFCRSVSQVVSVHVCGWYGTGY